MICVQKLGNGDERIGFRSFALIIAIVFVVFIGFTCITIREKSTVDVDSPSVGQMFRALIDNSQAIAVVVTIVLVNGSLYITSNLLIYFFKYDMAGATWYNSYTLFNTFGGAIQILSMMIFFPLFRKFISSIQVCYVSFGMAIIGYGVLFVMMCLGVNSLGALLVPAFFIFMAFGMLTVLTTIFLANTVDYGELINKRRDESVIFSMQTFVVKLASGIAALIASICLSICKLSDDTSNVQMAADAVNGSSVIGLRMTMAVIPMIGLLAAVLIFRKKYFLTEEKMAEIVAQLKGESE
jgi:melibiose permease